MKISLFDVEVWERDSFEPLADAHELRFVAEPLTPDNAGEHSDAELVSGFIFSTFDDRVLEQLNNLKLIATRSTGFDHIRKHGNCSARNMPIVA